MTTTKPARDATDRKGKLAWCEWWLERGAHMAMLEFCALSSVRYEIAEPFVVGDCLYATDGRRSMTRILRVALLTCFGCWMATVVLLVSFLIAASPQE